MMKRLLFVSAVLFGTTATAQNFEATIQEAFHPLSDAGDRVADTNWTYMNRGSNFFSYGAPDGGNAIGNGYLTVLTSHQALDGVGMHYDGVTADLTEILFWAAEGAVIGAADAITVAAYTTNADSTPNTLLASGSITTSDFDLTGGLTSSGVLTTTAIGGNDYDVIVEWQNGIDDTVGLVATAEGDGLGEGRLLMKVSVQTSTETGGVVASGWQKNNVYTGFDFDIMIFPVLDVAAGLNEIENHGLHMFPAYPNPATEMTTIRYQLDKADQVNVSVFNLAGQKVYTESGTKGAGEHFIDLNTSDLESGNYYYNIKTSDANLTMKFIVTK